MLPEFPAVAKVLRCVLFQGLGMKRASMGGKRSIYVSESRLWGRTIPKTVPAQFLAYPMPEKSPLLLRRQEYVRLGTVDRGFLVLMLESGILRYFETRALSERG